MFKSVMRFLLKYFLVKPFMAVFWMMSFLPILGNFGKSMYASMLFGEASGWYYKRHYLKAINAYEKAINYSQGMEDVPPLCISFELAFKALANMYENGLGVEVNKLKAEEYYLRAGSRGESAYEHKVATKSWYEGHWK